MKLTTDHTGKKLFMRVAQATLFPKDFKKLKIIDTYMEKVLASMAGAKDQK